MKLFLKESTETRINLRNKIMIYKSILKTISMAGVIGILSLTAYSSHASSMKKEHIKLESVASDSANITQLYLRKDEAMLELRGELKRHFIRPTPKRHPSRNLIVGHLDIELMDVNGEMIKESYIAYKQKPTRFGFATFYLPISDDIERISVIRVIHHETRSHTIGDS
jgi:hypothetical protein